MRTNFLFYDESKDLDEYDCPLCGYIVFRDHV